MKSPPAALLLAAGKSRRMGCCKQLLPFGGSTVIGRCLSTLVAGGIEEIVVVVSPEGGAVADAARRFPVRVAVNPAEDGDMASSARSGRDALSPAASGVIVALADYPLVAPSTVELLAARHRDRPGSIIIPVHDGRRGHPLLVPREILDGLSEGMTLRDLIVRNAERVEHADVNDPGILQDMDTPEQYLAVCSTFTAPSQTSSPLNSCNSEVRSAGDHR